MKLIKQFTCLVVCFVVLSSSFIVGYAAEDGNFEPAFLLPEDLIDMGYEMVEDDHYVLNVTDDDFSLYSSDAKSYDFNPKTDIPWSDFPDYIKQIVYMDCSDLKKTEGNILVPFVSAVVVSSVTVQIFVGTNVAWGMINDEDFSFSIWSKPDVPETYSSTKLYRLSWNYVNSTVVSDWIEYTPEAYGTKGNMARILNYYFNFSSVIDIYNYGGNGIVHPERYSIAQGVWNTGATSIHSFSVNDSYGNVTFALSSNGFSDKKFILPYSHVLLNTYIDYFIPPDESSFILGQQSEILSEQSETSKSILEVLRNLFTRIVSLPSSIAASIKDFFTNLGDRIDSFFTKFFNGIVSIKGESDLSELPDDTLSDYNDTESELVDDYNPDKLNDDLDIVLDSSALSFIWDVFDDFVTANNSVFTLFVSLLSIGLIALILGR